MRCPAKRGFRAWNPVRIRRVRRFDGRCPRRQCQGFLTGRFIVSKAKSDKVSPELDTPTDLPQAAVDKISAALNVLLADTFALYVKTKNFHWHVSGPHFRDYHLLLDEQAEQLEGSIDILAERARKVGGTTIRSIGQIAKLQRVKDNDKDYVAAIDMLNELMNDNKAQIRHMREAHKLADEHEDVATASLLENF